MSYIAKARLNVTSCVTEARLIARLTITECIELCNISERTWYRWRQSGAPTWAVRLILSQHASLDRFGWHDWEIRNGALHWNQLHHRYFWTPERLVLPLYNIQNSAAPWHAYADNLSSLEAAREAQKRAKTLQTKDIEPIPNLPTYAHNIYYVK